MTLIWRLCIDLGLGHLLAVGADKDVLAVVVRDGALALVILSCDTECF